MIRFSTLRAGFSSLGRSPLAFVLSALLLLLSACSSIPDRPNDICSIFDQNPDWFEAARDAEKRWGAPIHVQMAIIYYESGYRDDAKPGFRWLLGFIPLGRKSSAYGYAQALDGTWEAYKKEAGSWFSDRDDFEDATDFIGWYMNKSRKRLKFKMNDAYRHYLAYHEGQGGYSRGTFKKKKWLITRARAVAGRASLYRKQLRNCRGELES